MKKNLTKFLLVLAISFTFLQSCSKDDNKTIPIDNTEVVTVGTQVWSAKSLNVDKYRNGDEIPQVQDRTQWENLTTGAWCYYENNSANGAVYGKLYNWYAVMDPRGIAPTGYHVPSEQEWLDLSTFLGDETFRGGKMKETGTTHWASPNTAATNSSGFTGLPGGYLFSYDSTFYGIGESGYWWSSTENESNTAVSLGLYHDNGIAGFYVAGKTDGFSVRFLKD